MAALPQELSDPFYFHNFPCGSKSSFTFFSDLQEGELVLLHCCDPGKQAVGLLLGKIGLEYTARKKTLKT